MSKFLALLFGDPEVWANADVAAVMQAHEAFGTKHGASLVGGAELHPPTAARTIRGGDSVTDGPFVETKEALGGYYVIEAPDLDAAVEIARDIPEPIVEVRPVMERS